MNDELLKALQLIKDECKKHERCKGCQLKNADGDCGVQDSAPCRWKLEKREVYF